MTVLVNPNDLARRERRAALLWGCVVVGLLLVGIGTSIGGAFLALRGRPPVEDAYYNKALHWDDHAAMVQASAALGWRDSLEVGGAVTTAGERAVMVRLVDREGRAIEDAKVTLASFHRANPLAMHQAELKHMEGALYAASVPMQRAGIWEFRLTARRVASETGNEQTYIASLQRELP